MVLIRWLKWRPVPKVNAVSLRTDYECHWALFDFISFDEVEDKEERNLQEEDLQNQEGIWWENLNQHVESTQQKLLQFEYQRVHFLLWSFWVSNIFKERVYILFQRLECNVIDPSILTLCNSGSYRVNKYFPIGS